MTAMSKAGNPPQIPLPHADNEWARCRLWGSWMVNGGDRIGFAGAGLGADRRLTRWMIALACVMLGGTVGLAIIEGWDLWRSFFFTLITITTVGYGDEGISDAGRKFTTMLLIVGIGVVSYTFALIVQSAVTAELAWRKRMQKRIDRLRNHTIVCGFGRMGKTVCEQLAAAHEPFVVIEHSERESRLCESEIHIRIL